MTYQPPPASEDEDEKPGDTFTGQMHHGQRHGQGKYTWSSGATYEGSYVDNKKQGHGLMTYPDKSKYEGDWAGDVMEGQGTYHYASGDIYTGSFSGGKKHGAGMYCFQAHSCQFLGVWADGSFVEGKWNEGTFFFGSTGLVQEGKYSSAVLQHHPASACFSTYLDRNSPLLVAAGRGHLRLVQAIMEAAVMAVGPSKAKQRCINHTNHKGQSALTLACMNGHAQCVESLICNGASPLALDVARHNTALHWAASCCRSDCVQRLLSSSTAFQMRSGQVVQISEIPCFDEDNVTLVKFVDRHNGWGLTALHLAVFKGSHSTVRALLRGGASLVSVTVAGAVSNNPVRLPTGSTALHLAAAAEDLPLVKLLLEVQVSQGVQDQRRVQNSAGERPIDSVRSTTNLLLLHLLDPSQPFNFGPLSHAGFMLLPDALNPVTLGTLNPEYDAAGPAGGVLNIVTGGRSGYSVDLLGGPRQEAQGTGKGSSLSVVHSLDSSCGENGDATDVVFGMGMTAAASKSELPKNSPKLQGQLALLILQVLVSRTNCDDTGAATG
eukprot:gene7519-7730_t